MIRPVMAKFQLVRFPAKRKPADLMSKANTKHRNAPKQLTNVLHGIVHWFRIARAVRKKNSVRVHTQNIFRSGFRGHHTDFAVMIRKQPQDVLLDSEIECDDAEFSAFPVRFGFTHLLGPWRSRKVDRALRPVVRLGAAYSAS